jgi:hypothetical protein
VKYPSTCAACGKTIKKGEEAFYYPKSKKLYCKKNGCGDRAYADFMTQAEAEEYYATGGRGYRKTSVKKTKSRKTDVRKRDLQTVVIFRKFKNRGDIIALFPNVPYAPQLYPVTTIMSYMHLGQHGAADYYHVMDITVPAKPSEYDDLYKELVSIGYDNLVIRQKWMR